MKHENEKKRCGGLRRNLKLIARYYETMVVGFRGEREGTVEGGDKLDWVISGQMTGAFTVFQSNRELW